MGSGPQPYPVYEAVAYSRENTQYICLGDARNHGGNKGLFLFSFRVAIVSSYKHCFCVTANKRYICRIHAKLVRFLRVNHTGGLESYGCSLGHVPSPSECDCFPRPALRERGFL